MAVIMAVMVPRVDIVKRQLIKVPGSKVQGLFDRNFFCSTLNP